MLELSETRAEGPHDDTAGGPALCSCCASERSWALNALRIPSGPMILVPCRMPRASCSCALAAAPRPLLQVRANRWRACLWHHGLRCQCASRPLEPRRQRHWCQLGDNCTLPSCLPSRTGPSPRLGVLCEVGGNVLDSARSSTRCCCAECAARRRLCCCPPVPPAQGRLPHWAGPVAGQWRPGGCCKQVQRPGVAAARGSKHRCSCLHKGAAVPLLKAAPARRALRRVAGLSF